MLLLHRPGCGGGGPQAAKPPAGRRGAAGPVAAAALPERAAALGQPATRAAAAPAHRARQAPGARCALTLRNNPPPPPSSDATLEIDVLLVLTTFELHMAWRGWCGNENAHEAAGRAVFLHKHFGGFHTCLRLRHRVCVPCSDTRGAGAGGGCGGRACIAAAAGEQVSCASLCYEVPVWCHNRYLCRAPRQLAGTPRTQSPAKSKAAAAAGARRPARGLLGVPALRRGLPLLHRVWGTPIHLPRGGGVCGRGGGHLPHLLPLRPGGANSELYKCLKLSFGMS